MSCEGVKSGIGRVDFNHVKDTVIQGIELVFVPRGTYKAGLQCDSRNLEYDYWIGRFEITNGQYFHFLKQALSDSFLVLTDSNLLYHYKGDSLIPEDDYHIKLFDNRITYSSGTLNLDTSFANHPVTGVTWYGTKAFCDYFGLYLPTVAEWEKAARGSNNFRFPWGDSIDGSFANYYQSGDPFEPGTTPIGFYDGSLRGGFQTSNAQSCFGCYDMCGNAWEWVEDVWDERTPYHIGKGGGFYYHTPAQLQIYFHSVYGPSTPPPLDMCDVPDGFRVVYKTIGQ